MNCAICNKEFTECKELTVHLIKEHKLSVEELYKYFNYSFETREATCPICGNRFTMTSRQLKNRRRGTSMAIGCSAKCSRTLLEIAYGNPSTWERVKKKKEETCLNRYGVKSTFQLESVKKKIKETNLKNLGVEYPMQSDKIKAKSKKTVQNVYGVDHISQSEKIKKKIKKTVFKKYGTQNVSQVGSIKQKAIENMEKTNIEKYGVKYICQLERCFRVSRNRISKVNKKFSDKLTKNNIDNTLEFIIEDYGYDIKVQNTLIEINPYYTHNSTIGPYFGRTTQRNPKPINYHLDKTNFALEHNFKCIHIFDWDDQDKIINILKNKQRIYARVCEVKEISKKEAKDFLEEYHLQGSTKSIKYAYGLFHEEKLIQIMTFGKPRYNKKYEYELLRLCTLPEISVIGGASKILSHFEKDVNPSSLISYCDLSKFTGEVYKNLGFSLINQTPPARHWYNPKTKRHITDNLLRQRGFDQLHDANYGKGTSNNELMIEHGYVEIYDCGQLVFEKRYN